MGTGTSAAGGFASRLLALRTRAGLSQEGLAHAAGISVRALADLERGRSKGPQRRTVRALAKALKLDRAAAGELEESASLGRPRPRPEAATATRPALVLPRDIGDFTARGPALDRLHALARNAEPGHPPVAVIAGQPGLGKTAFAVHVAHRLAADFPDGQFVVDLRGMDPEPTTARDALASLLRALGVAESGIPSGTDDRAALYRAEVRERRLLLVLDNAASESQVRPLLPGTGRSMTIVTSRHALAGLESVHRTALGLLRREEGVELLTRIIGPERVRHEAQAVRDLVDLCGYLPLAVRIAGQRLAVRPMERVAKLVTQLARAERRLDTLQAGSLRIRAAFTMSYQHLAHPARILFRRASLAAGPDFSPETAALLADLPVTQAARYAEELTDAGLLQPDPDAERYRFHDLLRLFATEQLAAEDSPEVCEAARDRTAQWVLRRATAAALRFDADRHLDPPVGDPDPDHAPADREEARAWLEAERAEWLAALQRSRTAGRHQQVIDAAEAMHWFSDLNQHWDLWAEVFACSTESARALGSRRDEAVHLNYLAWAHNICRHDHPAALASAERALTAAREVADALQETWALAYAAGALHKLGRTSEGIERLQEAAALVGTLTSPQGRLAELSVLNGLGQYLRVSGRVQEALVVHRRSEAVCRDGIPGQPAELIAMYHAAALQEVGKDLSALHRWTEAEAPLRQALAHFETAQMPAWSEPARLDLGIVLRRLARYDEARETLVAVGNALALLKSPRQSEVAAELDELDRTITGE
ncbi:ATP-binding protein [Kitasatospora sp. NPDC001175]|uniref:ATP-binding protein n=1 Tax=Kitasatospora sp. NPDC001175 TaxID=3157103 RepID=UPI003D043668